MPFNTAETSKSFQETMAKSKNINGYRSENHQEEFLRNLRAKCVRNISKYYTRFFLYKNNFYKKMSLKNPKISRKC